MLFLVFWLVTWMLRIWAMMYGVAGIPSTKGLEFRLYPAMTATALSELLAGHSLVTKDGEFVIDPSRDSINTLDVLANWGYRWNGAPVGNLPDPYGSLTSNPPASDGDSYIIISPGLGVSYQQVATAVDWTHAVWRERRWEHLPYQPWLGHVKVVIISTASDGEWKRLTPG